MGREVWDCLVKTLVNPKTFSFNYVAFLITFDC